MLVHSIFLMIALFCLSVQTAFAQTTQEQKKKLAVVKITYEDFSQDERDLVNSAFYEHLLMDERNAVMAEPQA